MISDRERELERIISDPREELSVEYKDWLDLGTNEHRATLAKAAIAIETRWEGSGCCCSSGVDTNQLLTQLDLSSWTRREVAVVVPPVQVMLIERL